MQYFGLYLWPTLDVPPKVAAADTCRNPVPQKSIPDRCLIPGDSTLCGTFPERLTSIPQLSSTMKTNFLFNLFGHSPKKFFLFCFLWSLLASISCSHRVNGNRNRRRSGKPKGRRARSVFTRRTHPHAVVFLPPRQTDDGGL